MIITVKNPFKVEKAERLMLEQATLAYFFTKLTDNSWELKREEECARALIEVTRYFTNINYTVE
jgi:hypothetical protein